ncbi:MAG: type II secretion system protein GspM [Pseudomonadota bacterium]
MSGLSAALSARLAPLQSRWRELPTRDRRALTVLGLALAAAVCWFAVVVPVTDYAQSARDDLQTAREDLGWMQANAVRARQASAHRGLEAGQSLLSAVNASAQQAGLNLQRFEPDGEQRVRVTLENAVFTDVMRWIVDLERRYGLRVEHFNADVQSQPGLANIRLTLGAPP